MHRGLGRRRIGSGGELPQGLGRVPETELSGLAQRVRQPVEVVLRAEALDGRELAQWVASTFTAQTVGGVTVYDLTSGA